MKIELINNVIFNLYIFILSSIIGFEIISKVPTLLHTPLMSGSNAISGIIIIGAITTTKGSEIKINEFLSYIAFILAAINVIGGFAVTNRMLKMFKNKK